MIHPRQQQQYQNNNKQFPMVDTAYEVLDTMLSPVTSRKEDYYLATPSSRTGGSGFQQYDHHFLSSSRPSVLSEHAHDAGEDLTSWLSFLDTVERVQQRPAGARLFSPTGPSRKRLRTSFLAGFSWENQQQHQEYLLGEAQQRAAKLLHLETSGEGYNHRSARSMEEYWQQQQQQPLMKQQQYNNNQTMTSPLFVGLSPTAPAHSMTPFQLSEMPQPIRVVIPRMAEDVKCTPKAPPKQLSPGNVSAHSGEMRLRINFTSFGDVDESTPVFGKSGFFIPDGLCGTHEMYDQHWRFEIRHETMPSSSIAMMGGEGGGNKRRTASSNNLTAKLITWIITNETSGSITCITETPQQAALRELSGRTICNKVVRVALNHRAQEIEDSLHLVKDETKRQALANAAASLRPRLCTVGLLFFGLLHEGVQIHLRNKTKNLD